MLITFNVYDSAIVYDLEYKGLKYPLITNYESSYYCYNDLVDKITGIQNQMITNGKKDVGTGAKYI